MDTPFFPHHDLLLKNEGLQMLSALPAAIYICDADGKITFYNEAAVKLWGRRPEIGKDLWSDNWKIFSPEGNSVLLESCPMSVTLKEGRVVNSKEFLVERHDGVRLNIVAHPQPIFDEHGKLIGATNMLVDITTEKKKEAALFKSEQQYKNLSIDLEQTIDKRTHNLKKSEERYHKMIEEVQDYAILLLDQDGFIMNWNRGAENIKGYKEEEIVGKNFSIFYRKEDNDNRLPQMLLEQAATTGKAMHEGWRVRKDGSTFWGYIVITALHDETGNIIGYSKVTRDLTEKKIADDQLKDYASEIEFRNKQLEEFAYIASHDLQEPLRKILTFSNLLELHIDDKEAVLRHIEKINGAAGRMSILIKDVLKYSQLSRVDDLFEQTDLTKILQDVLGDFDLLIEERNVTVVASELPVITGIPIQLHQLFANLIGNAIKFSEENPRIEITAEYLLDKSTAEYLLPEHQEGYIRLQFKDYGSGFDQQYAEQLFKMFKRLNSTQSGTGIGLALCKKIVDNHKGTISATSRLGEGSVFDIVLPA